MTTSQQPETSHVPGSEIRLPMRTDFVAGHLFFCRRIELPLGLEESEERGVVELELEQMAPFPLEHLNYGYRLDGERKFAFVYAAYRKRLNAERVKAWASLDMVVPEFALALTLDGEDRSPLVLVSPESILVFKFDHRSHLPASIKAHARMLAEEATEDHEKEEVESVLESCEFDERVRVWDLDVEALQAGRKVYFKAVDRTDGTAWVRSVEREATWCIDVRDHDTVKSVQAEDKRNVILWKGILACALVCVLLLLGELIYGGASGYLAMRNKWNAEQTPRVNEIGAMQTTIYELGAFEDANLDPIRMLAAIEPLRDQSTIYRKVETEGPFTLILEVDALNLSMKNEFKRNLEELTLIQSVQETREDSNNKGSTATLVLQFFPDYVEILEKEVASNG